MKRCYSCMEEYKDIYDMCPYCGYEKDAEPRQLYFLHPGMIIAGRYEIGVDVGEGGFGITYKALDKQLNHVVAIKEYYPSGMVNRMPGETRVMVYDRARKDFLGGKERFLEEAKNMAKYDKHPNIVNVYDFFEENGTAYIVMEFLDGINYKEFIKENGGKVDVEMAVNVTKAMLSALEEVHKNNIIHRDISPDNIFICKDGRIKLIDFGAARFSSVEDARTRSIVLKRGFAPPEQYQTRSKQGPWTDIYALGATLYRAITGSVPEESVNRTKEDLLVEPKEYCPEISQNLNNTILRAMALQPELRFQNTTEFLKALETTGKIRDVRKELKRRKRTRIITIAGACAAVLLGTLICVRVLENRKADAGVLKDAEVSIWVEVAEGQSMEEEQQSFESALSEFKQEYPQITLDIQYINEAEYNAKVQEAIKNGNLPTLLESNTVSKETYNYLEDVSAVFKYIEKSKYFFYDTYDSYYPNGKQLPLAFCAPIIYRNAIMEEDKSLEQLIADGNFVVTESNYLTYYNLYGKSTVIDDLTTVSEKLAGMEINAGCQESIAEFADSQKACLIADVSCYDEVQQSLAGIYEVYLPSADGIVGSFEDCFSISKNASSDEQAAAVQILVYLLADSAQDVRYVQNGQYLPVNRTVYQSYVGVNHELEGLEQGFSKMLMAGEEQAQLDAWYESLAEK